MIIDSDHVRIKAEVVAGGLQRPWAIALLRNGRFLVTERDHGRLRLGSAEGSLSEPLAGVNSVFRFHGDSSSQAGLFDVKTDPEFESNNCIYLSYSKPTDAGAAVAIDRAVLVTDPTPHLTEVTTIFELKRENQDSASLHFGGRMAWHPADHTLFITIGDRRNMNRAQNLADQAGKILRMHRDGTVPDDNPFIGDSEADPYVYSYGHRNSQGIAFNPQTHELWENEHGPQGGDELNRIEARGNYGWPLACAGTDYSGARVGDGPYVEGTIPAVHYFEETVAPSGLAFVTGGEFTSWHGDLLTGGLMTEGLVRQRIASGKVVEHEHISIGQRIRDVQLADDGTVWLVTDETDGQVLKLSRAS